MMGRQPKVQKTLFYTTFNLGQRARKGHVLRKIVTHVNFDYIYKQVEDTYDSKGNVSVPPPVILKMILLLIPSLGLQTKNTSPPLIRMLLLHALA